MSKVLRDDPDNDQMLRNFVQLAHESEASDVRCVADVLEAVLEHRRP